MLSAEKISKQSSIEHIAGLLVANLMQICNEKEPAKQGKAENVHFEES